MDRVGTLWWQKTCMGGHPHTQSFVLYFMGPFSFCLQEFPFFTLTSFPPGFLVHVGGVVSARSVKLLDRIHNPGEFSKNTHKMLRCSSSSSIGLKYRVSVWSCCNWLLVKAAHYLILFNSFLFMVQVPLCLIV